MYLRPHYISPDNTAIHCIKNNTRQNIRKNSSVRKIGNNKQSLRSKYTSCSKKRHSIAVSRELSRKSDNEGDRQNEAIKLFSLNVGGISSKYDLGILDIIVQDYDLLCFSETKTNYINNISFSGFKVIEMPIKKDNHKYGGIHGIALYVKENLYENVTILCNETNSESILWCKINQQSSSLSFILGVVYLPHEGSIYHHNEVFDNLIFDIASLKSTYNLPFVLTGDFNSRTGITSDFIDVDEILSELCGIDLEENFRDSFVNNNIPVDRYNQDSVINENGKKLIEACLVTDLKFLNGRFGEDSKIGQFTCHTGMGSSVVDYTLISPSLISNISEFSILLYDRAISDTHCAMSITLIQSNSNMYSSNSEKDVENDSLPLENHVPYRLTWEDEQRDDFSDAFDDQKITELSLFIQSLDINSATTIDMEMASQKLKEIFVETAKDRGLFRIYKPKNESNSKVKKIQKPWFNKECEQARKEYIQVRNQCRRINTPESKSAIKKKVQSYKKVIKTCKLNFQKELHLKLRNDKKSNPKSFWNLIKGSKSGANIKVTLDLKTTLRSYLNPPQT